MLGLLLWIISVPVVTRPAFAATELARVNGTVITLEEFEKRYQEGAKYYAPRVPKKREFLEDWIKRELGLQEAKKTGFDRTPEAVDRINSALYQAFIESKLAKDIKAIDISDTEAKESYLKHPDLRTSHLFVALSPNAPADDVRKAYERMKTIYDTEVRPGKTSFAEVAQRFSEGLAASQGGDLGYQAREKLDPVYYQTALGLGKVGAVSGIVRTQFGYHVIKLTGIRAWDEVDKIPARQRAFEEKRMALFEKLMTQLRSRAKVSTRFDLLKE